jgi:hypothetical protein
LVCQTDDWGLIQMALAYGSHSFTLFASVPKKVNRVLRY